MISYTLSFNSIEDKVKVKSSSFKPPRSGQSALWVKESMESMEYVKICKNNKTYVNRHHLMQYIKYTYTYIHSINTYIEIKSDFIVPICAKYKQF